MSELVPPGTPALVGPDQVSVFEHPKDGVTSVTGASSVWARKPCAGDQRLVEPRADLPLADAGLRRRVTDLVDVELREGIVDITERLDVARRR